MAGKVKKITSMVRRPAMHTVAVFTGFLLVSVLLWCFVSFNRDVTLKQVPVVVSVTNCPPGYRFVDHVPDTVLCNVSGAGMKLLVAFTGEVPRLTIDFDKFANKVDHVLSVPSVKSLLSAQLSTSGITVTDVGVTSIHARYADSSKRVMVAVMVDENKFDITDEILLQPDSVTIFGSQAQLDTINDIEAPVILEEGVRAYDIRLLPPGSALLADPPSVHVEVNFIKKVTTTETVVLSVVNVPPDLDVTLVPGKVQATYTTTLDRRSDRLDTIAFDYTNIKQRAGRRLPLDTALMMMSHHVENMAFNTDSVEVVVERKP